MKIIVGGGRHFKDRRLLFSVLDVIDQMVCVSVVINGGGRPAPIRSLKNGRKRERCA